MNQDKVVKKVLIILNYRQSKGGIAIQVDLMLEKYTEIGVKASVFNTKATFIKRLILPLKLFLKGMNSDIFHIHGSSNYGFYPIIIGVLVGKLIRKKIVITYHGGGLKNFINKHPRFVKYFLSRADILTVPSKYLSDILKNKNIDYKYLPNIIREDNVKFKNRKIINPNFITTRSLEKVYNIELAINAFSIIKKKYSEAKLTIVGDGSLREELETYAKQIGLKEINFLGLVDNPNIGEVLNSADIYINPTTADNMPLSLFEAFSCGLPVISTNVGGLPDFIEDNFNGFLVNSNDINQLVDKIEFVLLNQDNSKRVLNNAFGSFENYTWRKLKNEYSELYNK